MGAGIIGGSKTETRLHHRRSIAQERNDQTIPPIPSAVHRAQRRLTRHVRGPMHQAWLKKQAADA